MVGLPRILRQKAGFMDGVPDSWLSGRAMLRGRNGVNNNSRAELEKAQHPSVMRTRPGQVMRVVGGERISPLQR